MTKQELSQELARIGALKFGEFKYKSGTTGPLYMDLRLLISHPELMKKVAKLYSELVDDLTYDRIAGVAYAALPIAGALSLERNEPWIFMRKEAAVKGYGLKKGLEGEFNAGETVLIVEDLVNKGTSVLEVADKFSEYELKAHDVAVLIDYGVGAREKLAEKGLELHAFITMREIVDIMHENGTIDAVHHTKCVEFLSK